MNAVAGLHPGFPPAPGPASGAARAAVRPLVRWLQGCDDGWWPSRKAVNARRRQQALVLAVPLVALFGVLDPYISPEHTVEIGWIRYGILTPTVVAALAVTTAWPFHKASEYALLLGVLVAGACLTAMTLIAPPHFAGILIVIFASYVFLSLRFTHASGAGLSVGVLYGVAAIAEGRTPWSTLVANMFFLASCNAIGGFACYALEQAARRQFQDNLALGEQRRISERLLRNVLPARVARRLKAHPGTIADAHQDVTIMFADIVDFTSYAAAIAPARLVRTLDQVFTHFDGLAQKHGLEKIKTIGDAYMVAGGLSGSGGDHVRAVVEMALDMLDSVGAFDLGVDRKLGLRIGIHTGPVVAGVIGRTKLAYDLWGDTVNVASRLESLAIPGTVQVSESTYQRLRERYGFSPRRVVPVRGLGELPCYVLVSRHAAAANGSPEESVA